MKNFTNNFKQFTSRLSARWLIMALMLLVGTSSAWGATRTFNNGDYIYIKNFKPSGWGDCWIPSNGYAWAHMWGGTAGEKDYLFELVSGTAGSVGAIYRAKITSSGTYTSIIFTRNSTNTGPWNDKWNQTGAITLPSSGDCATSFSSDGTSATWSTYTPPCTPATITWDTISATMSKGSTQTISTTLTSGAGSVTYKSSNTNVITVSGSKLTAVGNGTATITATHSTVTSGYCTAESITKSVTVSTVIPSGTKLYFDFSKATAWGTGHYLSIVAAANSSYIANNSNTSGAGSYKPKSDATWVELTNECEGIYSYTTTSDISTGISLWSTNESSYDQVWQTDVILNIKASEFDSAKKCYTLGSTITYHGDRQTDCFGGSWGSTIPVCCTPVEASQYTIDDTEYTWDGKAKKPTVTANTGAGTPTSTVYKQGDTEVENPTNVGTYDVYVSSNDGTPYCGANNLNVGSFEIKCKGGTASSLYTLTTIEFEYNGAPRHPGIDVATGAGTVASIEYKQGNTVVASPINVGSYDVYITSNVGTGYCAITTLTKIGTYEIKCKTATASQYTISQSSFTYDGSAKKPTVSKASGATAAGEVTSTVYKQGDTTVDNPINAGTYDIYITTEAGTGYCALTNFKLGSFTINGKDPVYSDFTYTNSKNYTGSALSADVAWKTNLAAGVGGAITTYYKVKTAADNTYTTTAPTAVGTYTVAVTTAAGGNYAAASQKIVLGDFTINEVCEPIAGLYWEITEGKNDIYCPGDEVEVRLTYKGSEAKAHAWGGNWSGNIDILADDYATGTVYTMTINKSGSVNLTLTDCDDKTASTETLYFTVATAPAAPELSPSGTINVGQNKSTTITVNNMDANATYVCYKGNTQVGTWNGNSVSFNVGDATGDFTYSIVATNKTCGDLTATTEFTIKVEEAGVKIAALGSKALYTNDPTHFIPLYVSNEDLAGVGANSVKKYTWQFSADGTSGWDDCTRNYGNFNAKNNKSNSKVVVSNGSDKSNNYRANKVGYYRCKLTYDNDEEQVSGNIQVTEATNNKTNKQHIGITYNLPIISVNTGAKSFPSDQGLATKSSDCGSSRYPSIHADDMKKKISVDVMMFNPDGTICYDRKARMNYRGSSSLNFKKKSYAFVTGKEKTKNLDGDVDTGKANLFGLSNGAEDKDWVLYAATPDPSMMRNRLVFDLYQKMRPGEWGVNSMYVELVVNGEYRGVYVLMDKITCNENRVNIKNENGFIVKFDKTDVVDRVENTDGDQKTFATSRTGTKNSSNGIESYGSCIDQRFEIEYPEKEDIELWDAFYGKVQQRFEDFETALEKKDYATVRTLIDYNSWADWFIITELAKNQDGFRASCIFVYDGDKIEARPLWDQELSFNNGTRVKHGIDSPDGLLITTSSVYNDAFYPPFWFTGHKGTNVTGGLLNDPCFVSLVKQKWATYQSGICSAASIGNMVTAYNTELGGAISREAARWPYTEADRGKTTDGDYIGYYSQGEGNPDQYSYAASKNAITAWISDRSTALTASGGLGNAINNLKGEALIFTITPSSAETTPWQQVQLTVNAPAGYEYTLNVDELKADNAIIKENGDSYGIKIPRPAAWGVGGNGTEQSKQYNVTATIEVSGENACGTIQDGTATSTITLKDVTEKCDPEIIKP